ncbi:helix-turn-helix domain-containing protein [Streptomyces cinereoruber]|uniref:hypothetical protein n=1 Tax=Streptomyces cinereoruber TaxID=67260 RepID=UPI0036683E7C
MILFDLLGQADEVTRGVLAKQAGLSPATVGDCMGFLADLGLTLAERGRYALTDTGREFAALWQHDSARARLLLHPLLMAHWSAPAAAHHLAGGPLPQEELAKKLRTGLPGVALRGMYMVEWLTIGRVVIRDEQLRVHLAPPPGQNSPAPMPPAPTARRARNRPAGNSTRRPPAGGRQAAEGERLPAPRPAPEQQSPVTQSQPAVPEPEQGFEEDEPAAGTTLLGLTRQEVQALPDARYAAFLDGVLQSLRSAHAPTP